MGYFPVDEQSIDYLKLIGCEEHRLKVIETYLKKMGLYRTYDGSQAEPNYSGEVMELDLATVVPCIAGPKRPHDRVPVSN